MPAEGHDTALSFLLKGGKSPLYEYATALQEGEDLFEAASYAEAIPQYEKAKESLEKELSSNTIPSTQWQLLSLLINRLMVCHYFLGNYYQVIFLGAPPQSLFLRFSTPQAKEMELQRFYLLALAHKKLKNHEKAIEALERCSHLIEKTSKPSQNKVHYEMGSAHFSLGRYNLACQHFEAVFPEEENPRIFSLAQLSLAHLEIVAKDYSAAEKRLLELSWSLAEKDPLHAEIAYLLGEIDFQQQNYAKSAKHFEKAIASNKSGETKWDCEVLYRLGNCYLKTGEVSTREHLNKAEVIFHRLLNTHLKEQAIFALAHCYLIKGKVFQEEHFFHKVEELLSDPEILSSKKTQAQALLLRAEATISFPARNKLFQQVIREASDDVYLCSHSWYFKGLNELEEAQRLLNEESYLEAQQLFSQAISSLKNAYEISKNTLKKLAGSAFKSQIYVYLYQKKREAYLQALPALKTFFEESSDIFQEMEDPDEVLYLYGLIASHLAAEEENQEFEQLAQKTFHQVNSLFPNGRYGDLSLSTLGSLFFQREKFADAEATFQKLVEEHPHSPFAADALFWTAACAEKLEKKSSVVKELRRRVFEDFPSSLQAPEAYFFYYSFEEYLQGNPKAIQHLKEFESKFPHTPFLINAYYLIALDHKKYQKLERKKGGDTRNLLAAIDAFQKAESTFESCYEKSAIALEDLPFFATIYYRAILEKALANLSIAQESKGTKKQIYLKYAEDVFKKIIQDFEKREHVLTSHFHSQELYPKICEESEFGLAQTYLTDHHEEEAQRVFNKMLEKYRQAKITRSYFLSLVWQEKGKIEMEHNTLEQALVFLKNAEDTSKGSLLSSDQKLELWIQQSECYRKEGKLDKAMAILSKVINDDVASNLRIKAMYLRAEIYEEQGRQELAIKQLEAATKKRGAWGAKAQEKLRDHYGIKVK